MKRSGILALGILAACGGSQAEPLVPEPREGCSGNTFVSVINDWDRAVEVYAVTRDGGTTTTPLGVAHPGSASEFMLPADAVGATATTPGLSGPIRIPSRARSLVRLRYVCR